MSLPTEYYYEVRTAAAGGIAYLVLGVFMICIPGRWPELSFALVPSLARKVRWIGTTSRNVTFVRAVGILFTIVAVLLLVLAVKHYLWIKEIEPLS